MRIDGHLATLPSFDHPEPAYWQALRVVRAEVQENQCGTCWRTAPDHVLELHHRCYCNFGKEPIAEVIMLCTSCHEAITSRIRSERYALGDRSADLANMTARADTHTSYRPEPRALVTIETKPDETPQRFRPASRYI